MIAIKDKKIPKSCWNCNFCCNKNGYYCEISHNLLAREVVDIPSENRPTNCPLTEIITYKDCKHKVFLANDGKGNTIYMCDKHLKNITNDNFFCGDGKRRG